MMIPLYDRHALCIPVDKPENMFRFSIFLPYFYPYMKLIEIRIPAIDFSSSLCYTKV